MAWADDDWGDRAMEMSDLTVGVSDAGTVATMDVSRLGGEIPSGVQCNELRLPDRPHRLDQSGLLKALMEIVEEAEQIQRGNRIQRLPNVVVTRDVLDLEERTGIVASASSFHGLLETEERGALGEEDCKGRQRDIGHAIAQVIASTPIGQRARRSVEAPEDAIEATVIHAIRNAGTGSKVQVTIV